jgi:hypothetical protein
MRVNGLDRKDAAAVDESRSRVDHSARSAG